MGAVEGRFAVAKVMGDASPPLRRELARQYYSMYAKTLGLYLFWFNVFRSSYTHSRAAVFLTSAAALAAGHSQAPRYFLNHVFATGLLDEESEFALSEVQPIA